MPVIIPPNWHQPDRLVTPHSAWLNRRELMLGGTAAASIGCIGTGFAGPSESPLPAEYAYTLPPFTKPERFRVGQSPAMKQTDEKTAASYNNYYEFTTQKDRVWREAKEFKPVPWTLEVTGHVAKPMEFGLEDLLKLMPLEERNYRFRCVEAWSMVIPWIGFPLRALLDRVKPLGSAKYVRLQTLDDPKQFPGVRSQPWYPWPYFEGLSLAEANHELTMLAVGIYGHALPNQHGAPLRLVVPWKYGYKNIKAITKIELVAQQPPTFWNTVVPGEYDFLGNVRPDIPHLRWSQATDRVVPTGERVTTPMYNGYAERVAGMYPAPRR